MESTLKRTWAEISLDNLTHNFETIRRQVGPKAKLLGVVKADAYGHGAVRVAKHLERLGAGYLAVSNLDECEELRVNGITLPILMLGFTPADQAERILKNDMTQAVPNLAIAEAYSSAAVRAGGMMKVHIKLDTGMGRLVADAEVREHALHVQPRKREDLQNVAQARVKVRLVARKAEAAHAGVELDVHGHLPAQRDGAVGKFLCDVVALHRLRHVQLQNARRLIRGREAQH